MPRREGQAPAGKAPERKRRPGEGGALNNKSRNAETLTRSPRRDQARRPASRQIRAGLRLLAPRRGRP